MANTENAIFTGEMMSLVYLAACTIPSMANGTWRVAAHGGGEKRSRPAHKRLEPSAGGAGPVAQERAGGSLGLGLGGLGPEGFFVRDNRLPEFLRVGEIDN